MDLHLLGAFLLTIAALLIADYLAGKWMDRQERRKRLEARIDQLKREDERRREQTLNTRGKAP